MVRTMVRTLAEITADKKSLKAHKKNAVFTVKRLIFKCNLTKGDLSGKTMKQLEG